MRILIDADGCPVVNETIKVAHKFNLESISALTSVLR